MFGPDIGQIIGNPFTFVGMHGIGGEADARYAPTVPFIIFFAYQMMFAVIAPALVTGSFVSRFKFTPYILSSSRFRGPLALFGWVNPRFDPFCSSK